MRVLVGMNDAGWHVLADRAWPGTTRANLDVLLVGPGGVFVIDVKNWREVRIHDGRLWHGQQPQDDVVDKLLRQTAAVEAVLIEEGLAPTEVVPLLAFAGRRNLTARLGRVVVCGERDLPRDLTRRGLRLTADQVARLVARTRSGLSSAGTTHAGAAPPYRAGRRPSPTRSSRCCPRRRSSPRCARRPAPSRSRPG